MYIVNTSTSIVAIPTRNLNFGQSTIIFVSSTTDIGQLVTIFDIEGFLSTPQRIIVSTVSGTNFGPGVSSILLQQGFSYLTLHSVSTNKWNIANENAFPVADISYYTRGLQFSTLNVTDNFIVTSSITTSNAQIVAQTAYSSGVVVAPIFVSSIVINNYSNYLAGTPYQYFESLSASNTGSISVQSTMSTGFQATFGSNVSTADTLYVQSNLNIAGGYTGSNIIIIQSSFSTNQRILVDSNIVAGGFVNITSNVTCFSGARTSSLYATGVQATTLFGNTVSFPYATLQPLVGLGSPALLVISSISNSNTFIQTSTLVTSELLTPTIMVASTVNAETLTIFPIENAVIQNSKGSLVVSSVYTRSLKANTLYGSNYTSTVNSVSTNTSLFSTLFSDNSVNAVQSISTMFTVAENCISKNIISRVLNIGGSAPLTMNILSISSFLISTSFLAGGMSSFTTYSTVFNASGAVFNTRAIVNTGPITTSTLQLGVGIYATNSLNISSPSVNFSTANIQSASTQNIVTSSLYSLGGLVGAVLNYSTVSLGAPYMYGSTAAGLSSDSMSEFIIGQGTPYFPLHVVATQDRTVNGFIKNPSGVPPTYLNISYIYRTDTPYFTGTASIILGNPIVQSTLVTLSTGLGGTHQTYTLSNYQVDTKLVSSTIQYYLTGPETYSAPGATGSQQTLIAGGAVTPYKLAYSSDGGASWTTLPFVVFETQCNGIVWMQDKWIAVGSGTNTMAISYSGTVWYNLGTSIFSTQGSAVAYGSGISVAVGQGTNSIAYSYDGVSWAGAGTTIFTAGLGVATDGSSWIAVGQGSNTIARSTDGKSWTGQGTTVFSVAGNGVASNGTRWVAVGQGSFTLATSTNGSTWTKLNVFSTAGRCVAWNGSMWLAGGSGTSPIAYSSNGLTWTTTTCPLTTVNSITWSSNQWVAVGVGAAATIAVSSDGINWTVTASASFFSELYAVANRTVPSFLTQPNQTFLAAGQGTNALASSINGINWTPVASPFTSSTNCVAYNGSLWVAGGSGTYALAYSANGVTWTGVSFPNMTTVYSVVYGRSLWIAVGTGTSGYTRAQSADGINWTQLATGGFFSGAAYGIVWSQGVWVAVGTPQSSGLLFSLDGSTWVSQISSVFTTGRCIASNGTYFLAGGQGTNPLAYSVDGSVWTAISGTLTSVSGLAWGSRLWVAVGQGANTIAYSYDGVHWYGLGTSIFSVAGASVIWNGSLWIATGEGTNTLATSVDGITWVGQGTSVFSVRGKGISVSKGLPNTVINYEEPVEVRLSLSGVVQISPTVIEKPPRTNTAWDSRASSLDGYADTAFLQFKPYAPNTHCMAGLTENPTVTNSYTALNYAFSVADSGSVQIYELGVLVATVGSYQALDIFQILFDGTTVKYTQNSVIVRTVSRAVGAPLYLGISFNNPASRIVDLEFHPQYLLNTVAPTTPHTYTTINPSGFTSDPLVFSRVVTESVLLPSLWEIKIPLSGTLSNISTQLYCELYVSTNLIFSTVLLQNPFQPTVSTYTFSYLLTSNIPVTPGNKMQFLIHTQRGLGTTAIYSTTITNSIYNLSSIEYVQLVHNSSNLGQQTSDLTVWTANASTPLGTYITSNSGIEMNFGYMKWNSRQYGMSIENEYNDMQTRTITYTGSLYSASDSNLKYDIHYADKSGLYESIRKIPLHRYSFSDTFQKTFRTRDNHQLGVLTTDVAKQFPNLIHPVESEHLGLSNLETVDRIQFRYAHLGATQHLIARVSTLSGKIAALRLTKDK